MRNKKLLRAQRHLSEPITKLSNESSATGANIKALSSGLEKIIKYNGKDYSINLTEE
tara:strand:+ start:6272 stop:6442 length:171 start_codon:yes stop_codon:yes gene_type:complete